MSPVRPIRALPWDFFFSFRTGGDFAILPLGYGARRIESVSVNKWPFPLLHAVEGDKSELRQAEKRNEWEDCHDGVESGFQSLRPSSW